MFEHISMENWVRVFYHWFLSFVKSFHAVDLSQLFSDLLESFFMDSTTKMIPTSAAKASSVNLVKYLQQFA